MEEKEYYLYWKRTYELGKCEWIIEHTKEPSKMLGFGEGPWSNVAETLWKLENMKKRLMGYSKWKVKQRTLAWWWTPILKI